MTTKEFDLEFDILYDNAFSKGSRGLDVYEKSVFLTQAQEEIVKSYYSGYNLTKESFERTEDRRNSLKNLVKTYKTSTLINSNEKISNNSKVYKLPDNLWYIIYEQCKLKDNCIDYIEVKPVTHDEYGITIDNPFRRPNKRKVIRLDVANVGNNKVVELISATDIEEYIVRYLKKPSPIIIANFEENSETSGLNLLIDGKNTITECELDSEIHRDILYRAVELAKYR